MGGIQEGWVDWLHEMVTQVMESITCITSSNQMEELINPTLGRPPMQISHVRSHYSHGQLLSKTLRDALSIHLSFPLQSSHMCIPERFHDIQ